MNMDEERKPKFSDIVGGLVAGVAQARSIADVEALRMAHRYRQIELLKGLPVPRLRIRRVSISIPMLISEVVPGTPCTHVTERQLGAKVGKAATYAISVIVEAAKKDKDDKTKPSDQTKGFADIASSVQKTFSETYFVNSLVKRLEYRYQKLNILPGATPVPDTIIRDCAGEVAQDMLHDALAYIVRDIVCRKGGKEEVKGTSEAATNHEKKESEGISQSDIEKQIDGFFDHRIVKWALEKIRNEAEGAAVKESTVSPDFYVSVDTETIKNAGGGPDTVTHFNMVLLEEGLEWVTETHDGGETSKLMQE
jgi:hypothetical protein